MASHQRNHEMERNIKISVSNQMND